MCPQIMKILRRSLTVLCAFLLSSCSFLSLDWTTEETGEVIEQTQPTEAGSAGDNSGVEIVWETPREPVDEFVIHYGYARDKLDSEIKVPVAQLETKDDPQYGSVFRYVLGDLEATRDVYVSLASIRQGETSPLSQVFEIKALR